MSDQSISAEAKAAAAELAAQMDGGIVTLGTLKRTLAALEAVNKRDKARVSGAKWRKPIPPHQQDVERAAVRERWAQAAKYLGNSHGDQFSGLVSGSWNYEAKVRWVAGRVGIPVWRVRTYLSELREKGEIYQQGGSCDSPGKADKLYHGRVSSCEACQQAGDACIKHASAKRIFAASLPDVPKKPRPSEKRAGLKKPRPIELRVPACAPRPEKGPRRGRRGFNTFVDDKHDGG